MFYVIVLIFTFVPNCCSVSWVYRSCYPCDICISGTGFPIVSGVKFPKWAWKVKYSCYFLSPAPTWLQVLCGSGTKPFFLHQGFWFFLSNSATGIKNQYEKHGDEVFCSSYFLEGPVWMHTYLGNGTIFLQE